MLAPVEAGEGNTEHASQAGWEALVAPLAHAAVLCLDDNLLAVVSLAQRCERVCVLARNEDTAKELRHRIAVAGWQHVSVVSLECDADLAVLNRSRFHGAVFCDLAGTAQAGVPGGLGALADLARPLLEEGAFVLIGTPNRWGLSRDRVFQRLRYARSWLGLKRLLQRSGALNEVVHPVLLNDYKCVSESITSRGYQATKNHGLRRERLKEWLWGARTARWFAPALIAVGWVGVARSSVVEIIGESLGAVDGTLNLAQYLALLSGKVIATFVAASSVEPARVVIVTRDPLTVERRTREAQTLRQLAVSLPPELAALLPSVLDRFTVDESACFVLRHVPGVTADAVVPGLAEVTFRAHKFLLDLHHATLRPCLMDDEKWNDGLGAIFSASVRRHPAVGAELRSLERQVHRLVAGGPWYDVCSHGDFKIENVMYDPSTFEITGVIDWEHALCPGWPYVDTAYLLVYNRMLHGLTWVSAARQILEEHFDQHERAVDAEYWRSTRLPAELVPAWRALAIVHHLGCRWHGVWAGELLDDLKALLHTAARLVESSSAQKPKVTVT